MEDNSRLGSLDQLTGLDFLKNWGQEARGGLLGRPLGRDRELQKVYSILSQPGKANVMVLGPPGVGKTALVGGLACDLATGSLPQGVRMTDLLELNISSLMSDTMYRGQMEKKVTDLLSYLRSRPDTVLFIDEIHVLLGAGRSSGSGAAGDISQTLKPALARGDFVCIGATTDAEYEQYVKPDGAFCRRFFNVTVSPLTDDAVVEILLRKNAELRFSKGIHFSPTTLRTIVRYTNDKMPNRFQPDKSLDLLTLAAARVLQSGVRATPGQTRDRIAIKELRISLAEVARRLEQQDLPAAAAFAMKTLGVKQQEGLAIEIDAAGLQELLEGPDAH